jgi:hypothetical protein
MMEEDNARSIHDDDDSDAHRHCCGMVDRSSIHQASMAQCGSEDHERIMYDARARPRPKR